MGLSGLVSFFFLGGGESAGEGAIFTVLLLRFHTFYIRLEVHYIENYLMNLISQEDATKLLSQITKS